MLFGWDGKGVWVTHSLRDGGLEHGDDVLALNAVDVETFGPALENTMVYVILSGRVRESETKRETGQLLATVVRLNELLETVGNVLPEFLGVSGLEILGHAVLGLDDVEFALRVGQDDLADSEVGSAHVKGEESSLLMSVGEGHAPCWVHGLWRLARTSEGRCQGLDLQCYRLRR